MIIRNNHMIDCTIIFLSEPYTLVNITQKETLRLIMPFQTYTKYQSLYNEVLTFRTFVFLWPFLTEFSASIAFMMW